MNTQLYLADMEVDLTDVINIPLNKSFEDLSNPTNINNEFSKTIKLPVSLRNNEVLGNAFRLDRMIISKEGEKNIGKYLNPTKKIPFRLMNNSDLVMDGYAKLSLIDNSYDEKFYTINLFGTLGDLFHKLLNVAVNPQFTPELDLCDIWEDEENKITYSYAIPYFSGEVIGIETAVIEPSLYSWHDMRYLMNDYMGGKTLNADTIIKCWKNVPSNNKNDCTIDKIKAGGKELDIVGFAPTHHGFPNGFNPKTIETRDGNSSVTKQFNDIADERVDTKNNNVTYDHSALVGDGLTEEQFQQFISWQQKPYIYINKLFMLFQEHMNQNPDVFNDYKLEIDEEWTKTDNDGEYYNPYWSKLCYTLPFLYNKDTESVQGNFDITFDNNVEYRNWQDYKDTQVLQLRNTATLNYTGDKYISNVTLNGYACIALPVNIGMNWNGPEITYTNNQPTGNAISAKDPNSSNYIASNIPQLFFNHSFKRAEHLDSGVKEVVNGGYKVTVEVIDGDSEDNTVINSFTNVWAPNYLKDNKYEKYITNQLYENVDNGDVIDILNETDIDKAACLLPYTFEPQDEQPSLIKEMVAAGGEIPYKSYYMGMAFPLRSFGDIPIGIKHPKFRVTITAMAEYYHDIADEYQNSIGTWIRFGRETNSRGYVYEMHGLKLTDSFWAPLKQDYTVQQPESCCTTMFYQEYKPQYKLVKLNTASNDSLRDWLNHDSATHYTHTYSSGGTAVFRGGATFANGYGRYNSLVYDIRDDGDGSTNQLYDLFIGQNIPAGVSDLMIASKMGVGKCKSFIGDNLFIDNHHNPEITLGNLWTKESGLFNILLEYSKMFGLYWYIDHYNKRIQLLSKKSLFYYNTIEDWSNKVDRSKTYQITPILHTSKYINFDYDDEKDGSHYTAYGEKYLVNYGGYRLKTGYDFTPDDEDIFKGIQSSCFSNKPILTWNQIINYSVKDLPYVSTSPFTLLDCDTKDGKKSMEIENWIFRNENKPVFSSLDLKSGKFNDFENNQILTDNGNNGYVCSVIDDTPNMIATQKYMYVDNSKDYYRNVIKNVKECNDFPSFSVVSGRYGCLFAKPAQDYTLPAVGSNLQRLSTTDIKNKNVYWLYDWAWRRWMNERYNINNKKLTCYINLKPTEFNNLSPSDNVMHYGNYYFNNFKIIDGQLFMLNKIYDFNIQSSETTKCDFIQITDIDAYINEDQLAFTTFKLTDTGYNGKTTIANDVVNVKSDAFVDYSLYGDNHQTAAASLKSLPNRDGTLFIDSLSSGVISKNGGKFINDRTSYEFTKSMFNQNIINFNLYLKPYYTWFKQTNTADYKDINVTAISSTQTERDSLTYRIPNIQPYLKNTSDFAKNIVKVDTIFEPWNKENRIPLETQISIKDNLGLTLKYEYVSFYELTLRCKRYNTIGEPGTGIGADEIINLIIPSANHCVYIEKDDTATVNNNFYHTNKYKVYANDTTMTSDSFKSIFDKIKQDKGYFEVSLTKDGETKNTRPIKLITTIVYYLEGCSNDAFNDNQSSTSNIYDYVTIKDTDDNVIKIPLYYDTPSTEKIRQDVNLNIVNDAMKNNLCAFSNYNDYTSEFISSSLSGEHITANIAKYGQSYNEELPTGVLDFYGLEESRNIVTVPELGKSSIIDYYIYHNDIPYLIDNDVDGADGYAYQTFYQEMWLTEQEGGNPNTTPKFVVKVTNDDFKWNDEPVENIQIDYRVPNNKETAIKYDAYIGTGGYQDKDDITVTARTFHFVNGYYRQETLDIPYVSESTNELIIPINNNSYERYIRFLWVNDITGEYRELALYQSARDWPLGGD